MKNLENVAVVASEQVPAKRFFQLTVKSGKEYKTDLGWEFNDDIKESSKFESEDLAKQYLPKFIKELNISNSDVYEIEMFSYEINEDGELMNEDFEQIDFIDNSQKSEIICFQYFGQYQIAQDKYMIRYNYDKLSDNEMFARSENGSFRYQPVEGFMKIEEVSEWAKDKNIVQSDVKLVA